MTLLRGLKPPSFVLDGELAIPVGRTLSFDALQMRLHPAESRIRKLTHATPAIFIAFDLLATPAGESLLDQPLALRRGALEAFYQLVGAHDDLKLSPAATDLAWRNGGWRPAAGHSTGSSPRGSTAPTSRASARCSR